jgi:hypothetical protein
MNSGRLATKSGRRNKPEEREPLWNASCFVFLEDTAGTISGQAKLMDNMDGMDEIVNPTF